jgi:hypothetical protein
MAERGEYRFEIADLKPTTISMKRLKEYIEQLSELFGNYDDIHLIRVDDGSAVPCILAKERAATRVDKRLLSIKTGYASRKAYRTIDAINDLLSEDNTSAVLRSPYHSNLVIEFPGAKRPKDPPLGPIRQHSEVQGEMIQIGGRDETISVHVRSADQIFICTASRDQGRNFSTHLFRTVRIEGDGKWTRNEYGKWKLVELKIGSVTPLLNEQLSSVVGKLRAIRPSQPSNLKPLEYVSALKSDE